MKNGYIQLKLESMSAFFRKSKVKYRESLREVENEIILPGTVYLW